MHKRALVTGPTYTNDPLARLCQQFESYTKRHGCHQVYPAAVKLLSACFEPDLWPLWVAQAQAVRARLTIHEEVILDQAYTLRYCPALMLTFYRCRPNALKQRLWRARHKLFSTILTPLEAPGRTISP